jgi:hypothetical protein
MTPPPRRVDWLFIVVWLVLALALALEDKQ